MFILKFEIKVTSGTMPEFLLDNRLLFNLGILDHEKVIEL